MNTAKKLMKQFDNDVIKMMEQAEKYCIDQNIVWAAETHVYYLRDDSLLWFNSYGDFGDANLWFVFDKNNGIISNGFQEHDQAVDELLEYVKEYGKEECKGFFGIVDLFGEEEIYNG